MKKVIQILTLLFFIPVINSLSQTSMNTKLVGHWGTYGNSYCVTAGLNYLYIGSGPMFVVLDVSDPVHLKEIGALRLPNEPREIAISGNLAGVVDGYSGLRIINISDPTNPVETGFLNFSDYTSDVCIKGNYAYVTSYGGGLRIIDISDPSFPVEAGICLVPGLAMGVTVSGDYAYVAANWEGLIIIDISDPDAPVEVGQCSLPGYAMSLAVADDFAYIADWENKLRVLDVRDPSDPVEIAVNRTNGNPTRVFAMGNNVFVADGDAGLHIMDISNPYHLTSGFLDTPGNACDVWVTGNYAYVADEGFGLRIIDFSDPATLCEVGHLDTPGYSSFILTKGDYAYIADGAAGLRIVDITTPSNLTEIGSYDTPGEALELALYEDYVIIADGDSGLQIIDGSNLSSPVAIAEIDTIGSIRLVEVQGDYAYVTSDTNLYAIDIIDPANPVITGKISINLYMDIQALAVDGQFAYLGARRGSWSNYFYVIDIQSPLALSLAGELHVGNRNIYDITLVDNAPYLSTSQGVGVIDVSDPASPFIMENIYNLRGTTVVFQGNYAFTCDGALKIYSLEDPYYANEIGYFNTAGEVNHISVEGEMVFIADGDCGLCAIDVSDPIGPEEIGSYYLPGRFSKLKLYKNYIIAGDYDQGMSIIDISDNGNLHQISSFSVSNFYDLAIKEDRAYVVGRNDFRVVDLSNPYNPFAIAYAYVKGREIHLNGYYALVRYNDLRLVEIKEDENLMNTGTYPGYIHCLATEGRVAYTSDDMGLNIIDISNPYSPFLIASKDSLCAGSMTVRNDILYLADQDSLFQIIDASNPEDLVTIGYCKLPSVPAKIHIEENLAILACGRSGLRILDITDPSVPFEAGYYLTPGEALGLDVDGNMVYVADHQAGLMLIRHDLMTSIMQPPGEPAPVLMSCYPNPVNNRVTVSFTLQEASGIRIEVMSGLGDVLAVILDEHLENGEHRITWSSDGLPAGLYILRLTVKESKKSVARKMIKSSTE